MSEAPGDLRVIRNDDPAGASADLLLALLANAIDEHGHASLAVSGGSSPLPMFSAMAERTADAGTAGDSHVDWAHVEVFQVDERVAPDGHPDRNANAILDLLVRPLGIPDAQVHLMPVADREPEQAAADYLTVLLDRLGSRPVLDVVHLGLGDDGHTASLIPGSPVLHATADVVATEDYRGRRRVTMTAPLLNRAQHRVWQVPSADKEAPLRTLIAGTSTDPAGLLVRDGTTVVTDLDV